MNGKAITANTETRYKSTAQRLSAISLLLLTVQTVGDRGQHKVPEMEIFIEETNCLLRVKVGQPL